VTVWGKVAASAIAFAGIGVVALPTGIFASAFSDELRERERARRALLDKMAEQEGQEEPASAENG
jgi:voltage-gated potassium channel